MGACDSGVAQIPLQHPVHGRMRKFGQRQIDLRHRCTDRFEQRIAARRLLGEHAALDPGEHAQPVLRSPAAREGLDVRARERGHDPRHLEPAAPGRHAPHPLVLKVEQLRGIVAIRDLEHELPAARVRDEKVLIALARQGRGAARESVARERRLERIARAEARNAVGARSPPPLGAHGLIGPPARSGCAAVANSCRKSRNALNSRALPLGSRKNMVDCSPTWPLNRVHGSMTN